MNIAELRDLEAQLARLQSIFASMRQVNAGVAVLHLEATIAALESHLRKLWPSKPPAPAPLAFGLTAEAAARPTAVRRRRSP